MTKRQSLKVRQFYFLINAKDSLYFQGELTSFEMISVTALNSIYFSYPCFLILGISYFFLVQFLHNLVFSTDQSNFSAYEEKAPQVSLVLFPFNKSGYI